MLKSSAGLYIFSHTVLFRLTPVPTFQAPFVTSLPFSLNCLRLLFALFGQISLEPGDGISLVIIVVTTVADGGHVALYSNDDDLCLLTASLTILNERHYQAAA